MSLANENSKRGIRFNAIAPGLIQTKNLHDENTRIISNEDYDRYSMKYPLGLGKTNSVISLINFLISDESKWLTGQTIVLDGGFTIN